MSGWTRIPLTSAAATLLAGGTATGVLTVLADRTPWSIIALVCVVAALYGVVAGALEAYDLKDPADCACLFLDCTWSLPNTLFGTVFGLPVYLIFGSPSKADSCGRTWISYRARGSSGFGVDVLQTLGTVNIGGAGAHERVHLMQARIFGPLYLPLFAVFYVLTTMTQVLFTLVLGFLLKAVGARRSAHLNPPATSAVSGFFGWIYYATLFEVWAYATE